MSVILALPSKGRLREDSLARLSAAGLTVRLPENERRYRARLEDYPGVEIAFLSASEIARELGSGGIDLGVTGEDLVQELSGDWERRMGILARLGFGRADVVVAVPEIWLDVESMADLDDVAAEFRARHGRKLRIATKYARLTQQFFAGSHGIQVFRVVESFGATEGAPAAGSADVIVDITTTGETLRANHLKVLTDGLVLRSEACLVVSRRERGAEDKQVLTDIASRIARASREAEEG